MQNYETIAALKEARVKRKIKVKIKIFNRDKTKLKAFLSQLNIYFNYNLVKI
jgi:hypothetical protein